MINCYVNELGYYIHGNNIDIAHKLTPHTVDGEPVLEQLQHMYAVLYCALVELRNIDDDRIFVYHYSRIIDDMNGHKPLTQWFEAVRAMIRQRLIPDIKGVVLFRKKSAREVDEQVQFGISALGLDDIARDVLLRNRMNEKLKKHEAAVKTRAADLRHRWFNAKA